MTSLSQSVLLWKLLFKGVKIMVAVSQIFDRVKSVALWSANIRKLTKDHKGYGSAAILTLSSPIDDVWPDLSHMIFLTTNFSSYKMYSSEHPTINKITWYFLLPTSPAIRCVTSSVKVLLASPPISSIFSWISSWTEIVHSIILQLSYINTVLNAKRHKYKSIKRLCNL